LISEAEKKQIGEVREHLERLVASKVGSGVESAPLAKLYDHTQCKKIFFCEFSN